MPDFTDNSFGKSKKIMILSDARQFLLEERDELLATYNKDEELKAFIIGYFDLMINGTTRMIEGLQR